MSNCDTSTVSFDIDKHFQQIFIWIYFYRCFSVCIISVAYDGANKFVTSHRNIEPANYNDARSKENPIPAKHNDLVVEAGSHVDIDDSTEAHLSTECSTSQLAIVPLSSEPEKTGQQTDQNEIKPDIQQLGLRVANNNGILELIDESSDEDELNDVEIISYGGEHFEMRCGRKGFANPMILMDDQRVKRENDKISGSEPFYETVSKIIFT